MLSDNESALKWSLQAASLVPDDAYIICCDPVGQNTGSGKSYSSIFVLKSPYYQDRFGPKTVVASYFGRKAEQPLSHIQDLLLKLSIFYNAKISHETDNSGGGIIEYFLRKGQLDRLLSTPERVMAKAMINSKTNLRKYGHSMASDRHKKLGEDITYDWLDSLVDTGQLVDEDGNVLPQVKVRNLDLLEDELLIEQLITYSRSGNYDTISAFMGGMIQMKELFSFEPDIKQDDSRSISNQLVEYAKKKGVDMGQHNPKDYSSPFFPSNDGQQKKYF